MSWPRVINLFSVHFTALESNERKKKTNGDSTQSTRAVIGVGGMGGGGVIVRELWNPVSPTLKLLAKTDERRFAVRKKKKEASYAPICSVRVCV